LDDSISVNWKVRDGDRISADRELCTITGPARALLSAERSALNLLQTLSGTATQTRRCVDIVAGTGARILDTRKTIPGLRLAQKYAVVCGGGHNHRMGLYDGILIKENHLCDTVKIRDLVQLAKDRAGAEITVEIEVENLAELQAALEAGAPRILLDNFSVALLQQAVAANAGRAVLEASGGIDESTLRAVAKTGVDHISIGAITKDIIAVDFSMLVISPDN
jgi:nicotinate-nucleotide pyrophosphorylase (carboxylating)